MKPAKFKYVRAETAEHAVELLGSVDSGARILAGGQSLIPSLSARTTKASLLLDIMRCSGLNDVSQNSGDVTIVAACRQSRIELSPTIQQWWHDRFREADHAPRGPDHGGPFE
jgi:2-furoyl-CoA dehydrogenase FAD binding subunit